MPNPHVRCRIVRVDHESPTQTETTRLADELVLLVELPPADRKRTLAIEVVRGTARRDLREHILVPSTEPVVLAYRLHWRDRPNASTRLTCQIRLDGQLVGSPSVLLVPAAVDAQGRFGSPPAAPMSAPTRMAFLNAFDRIVEPRPENPGGPSVSKDDGGRSADAARFNLDLEDRL